MIAISNNELAAAEPVGGLHDCTRCGHAHDLKDSTPPGLQFVKCDDGTVYLVGVNGKRVGRGP